EETAGRPPRGTSPHVRPGTPGGDPGRGPRRRKPSAAPRRPAPPTPADTPRSPVPFPPRRSRSQTAPPAQSRPATINATRRLTPAAPDQEDSMAARNVAPRPDSRSGQGRASGDALPSAGGRGLRGIAELLNEMVRRADAGRAASDRLTLSAAWASL